ncbi:AraC family transcriptional regulator [Lacibacter luteus]|uniref:AraC family transcriptional regulator n=1 Tax=Lacibacter luteus TaxID=2508719 RepID=A0A4Q1CGC0_9BACT|nr:helix-turn-helix domain-containing protein [Lacibacter luteus]RXK59199.1 AraC family transcriptional regulator [Lacibacter luteus]
MNEPLHALTHAQLKWTSQLPENFPGVRLPGGIVFSCTSDFGTICIQEYATAEYRIRYSCIDVVEHFQYERKEIAKGVDSLMLLKGSLIQEFNSSKKNELLENQWRLLKAPLEIITSTPSIEQYLQKVSIWFSERFVNKLIGMFPIVATHISEDKESIQFPNTPGWNDTETLQFIQSILRCPYDGEWRKDYFDSRAKDLLFKFFVKVSREKQVLVDVDEREIGKINEAANLILKDIRKHFLIPDLAKRFLMNEYKFKRLFKQVYGLGPYDFLRQERLKKAIELLQEGKSVKYAAIETGWRPADLVFAYREKFGTTPSKTFRSK